MPILGAYMVPHPPMIVPAVGRGSERQVEATTRAYEQVAQEIAALAPDTIILTSPHATMYADYFHISPGKSAKGDFGRFNARQERYQVDYDEELTALITRLAREKGFPAGTMGERDKSLDHGTMVPLYFIREAYPAVDSVKESPPATPHPRGRGRWEACLHVPERPEQRLVGARHAPDWERGWRSRLYMASGRIAAAVWERRADADRTMQRAAGRPM